MKKTVSLLTAVAACAAIAAPATKPAAKTVPMVRAERDSAVYKVGEKIKFVVTDAGEKVFYTVNNGRFTTPEALLKDNEINVDAKEPGFVLVTLKLGKDAKGKDIVTYGGAAIEPEKIVPGTKRPADFEKFWQDEVANMRKSELEVVKKTPIDAKYLPEGFTGYDVEIRRGDVTATGYLVIPPGGKGTLGAVINFNGASKVSSELPVAIGVAKRFKAISFNLNFHGLKNVNLTRVRNRAEEAKMRPAVKNYQFNNGDDRQAYAMRKIFLRTVLSADYLRTLPEFDGKNLIASGGSLGGCQAIVCAALVPEVVYCVSNATAMCDHFGKDAGHLPGWPNLFERNPAAVKAAAYFDVVNFAPMVKCPVIMGVGFIDVTCPPATTYAAYNVLGTTDKKMFHSITGGHGNVLDRKRDKGVFSFGNVETQRFLRNAKKK